MAEVHRPPDVFFCNFLDDTITGHSSAVSQLVQEATMKIKVGVWSVHDYQQGDFYHHWITGQSFDGSLPELAELFQRSNVVAHASPDNQTHAAPVYQSPISQAVPVHKSLKCSMSQGTRQVRDKLVPRATADADCTGTRLVQETRRLTAMVRAIKANSFHHDGLLCLWLATPSHQPPNISHGHSAAVKQTPRSQERQ